jgi:hypothetical protein
MLMKIQRTFHFANESKSAVLHALDTTVEKKNSKGKGALSLGVKRPEREANNSPPSSAEIKQCVALYLHSPNMPSWRGDELKYRGNFTFTITSPSPMVI